MVFVKLNSKQNKYWCGNAVYISLTNHQVIQSTLVFHFWDWFYVFWQKEDGGDVESIIESLDNKGTADALNRK